jgi:hypothetical protein
MEQELVIEFLGPDPGPDLERLAAEAPDQVTLLRSRCFDSSDHLIQAMGQLTPVVAMALTRIVTTYIRAYLVGLVVAHMAPSEGGRRRSRLILFDADFVLPHGAVTPPASQPSGCSPGGSARGSCGGPFPSTQFLQPACLTSATPCQAYKCLGAFLKEEPLLHPNPPSPIPLVSTRPGSSESRQAYSSCAICNRLASGAVFIN